MSCYWNHTFVLLTTDPKSLISMNFQIAGYFLDFLRVGHFCFPIFALSDLSFSILCPFRCVCVCLPDLIHVLVSNDETGVPSALEAWTDAHIRARAFYPHHVTL